jgi:ubiquinone/menaquinone biosynthesis C-methylase UbiE
MTSSHTVRTDIRGDTMAAVEPIPPCNAAGFNASSDDVFGRIAARYDIMCDLFSLGLPVIGWIATGGDASAYRYLLQGIRDFPSAERLAAELRDIGFHEVAFERLSLGIVAIHVARKPVHLTSRP